MREPRCSLCGKSVYSGAVLTSVTDPSGTRSMACRAWCGETPAPVMSVERLEEARRSASTDLERELLAELDIAYRCVRRAEMDKYEAAGRVPDWVQETTHIAIELEGGRVLTASGSDWREWWETGTLDEAFEREADPDSHILRVDVFALDEVYVDSDGCFWAHRGDWQYHKPLMRRVDEHGRVPAELARVGPQFLTDLLSYHGPLTPVPRPAPAEAAE